MEPVSGISAAISAVGSLVSGAVSWLGSYVSAITASGNDILLLMVVAVPLVGLGVGLLKRLFRVN